MNEVISCPGGEFIKGIIPWMTPELLQWYEDKYKLRIDCKTGRIYFGQGFQCWMEPAPDKMKEAYRDRFAILVWTANRIKEIKEIVKRDKLLAMSFLGQNN